MVTVLPSSGVFVRPTTTSPAARNRRASAVSSAARKPASFRKRLPMWCGSPAMAMPRSFSRNGTPRNGPSGSVPAASRRAASNRSWITALISGFTFSMRSMAASTNSRGDTFPSRTSAACAVASSVLRSLSAGMVQDRTGNAEP